MASVYCPSCDRHDAGCPAASARAVTALGQKALVAAAKRGKAGAFEALLVAHHNKLLRTAHCITRNREDAEDAVQDSLLRAFVHIHEFDGRSSF
jgi:RNA polymerase sigma-70 factor, ECF subfamily